MTDNTRSQLIDMKRQLTPSNITEAELKSAFTSRPAVVKKFKGRQARLKGMITQWEPFKVQIEKYTAKKTEESKNLPEKIARLRAVVKKECAHPVDSLVVSSEYHNNQKSDPTSRTEYFVTCKLCHKKEMMKMVNHDSYGE